MLLVDHRKMSTQWTPYIVHRWSNGFVESCLEVVVEFCLEGRVPRELPVHPLIEMIDFGKWSTRHKHQGSVPGVQMGKR